jgi:hypothetical protein
MTPTLPSSFRNQHRDLPVLTKTSQTARQTVIPAKFFHFAQRCSATQPGSVQRPVGRSGVVRDKRGLWW